jgi:hypothetical protein
MVRSVIIGIMVLSTFLLVGANQKSATKEVKRNCSGYSVIEVDKGIDCNGDTIKLIKVNGYFERVR